MEREFVYMNAWKLWVTFTGKSGRKMTTHQFRQAGLFFDFDYPTILKLYEDYNWDEEKRLDFGTFRVIF